MKTYLSIDLGAGSGRVIAGLVGGGKVELCEVHRFDNPGTDLPGGSYWNVVGLYREILVGLKKAVDQYGDAIESIGIDTWGCDHGLFGKDGQLTGMVHQYRDERYQGMADIMHGRMSEWDIYQQTGVRTLFYNTSLHVLAEVVKENPSVMQAERLLFTPDVLAYWLTGKQAVERTIASTSQLLDPRTGDWAWSVIEKLGMPKQIFGPVVAPGTILGEIRQEVADRIGKAGIKVVSSASHDTASAVAGIPMTEPNGLWLSCGTWSIMGVESPEAITSEEAFEHGFSNELGVEGTVRFLKNISGLWVIQECKRQWELEGDTTDYGTLVKLAESAPAFSAWIDPDDSVFASPGGMPEKIRDWCRKTGQAVPQDKGTILRVATESLALKYRSVFERFQRMAGREFQRLHAGGGGIQNRQLCQFTANALGVEVLAGPIEATSCGNIITQMVATGAVADIASGRETIRQSFEFAVYQPQDCEAWQAAYAKYQALLK